MEDPIFSERGRADYRKIPNTIISEFDKVLRDLVEHPTKGVWINSPRAKDALSHRFSIDDPTHGEIKFQILYKRHSNEMTIVIIRIRFPNPKD